MTKRKFKTKKAALKIVGVPSDIEPVYGKDGKIKYWREKEPDGPGGWMRGSGLKIRKA
tara:strand:- start:41 stop:214 length:174 start_codon:yes stop_codon:yes gene_type:complete